jgi:hypothetical protein
MRKIILIGFIFSLIIGLSYLKALRDRDQADDAYQAGLLEGDIRQTEALGKVDSLQAELGNQRVAFADSLMGRDMREQETVDSLSELIEGQEEGIVDLKKKLAATTKKASSRTQVSKKMPDKRHQILTYYKQRHKALPGDLSEYEHRVALSEIRQETTDKFKITLAELSRIRKQANLDY